MVQSSQSSPDVFDCRENAYYFSLFLDHRISLFLFSQGYQPCSSLLNFVLIFYIITTVAVVCFLVSHESVSVECCLIIHVDRFDLRHNSFMDILFFFSFLLRCIECRRGLVMRILSVCLSVTHVNCDKTVERSVQIFIPYERSFSLVF